MQKEKILSELYHGNIRPAEKEIVPGSDYRQKQLKLIDLAEALEQRLNDEEKKMLDEIMTAWGNLNYLSSEEYFPLHCASYSKRLEVSCRSALFLCSANPHKFLLVKYNDGTVRLDSSLLPRKYLPWWYC